MVCGAGAEMSKVTIFHNPKCSTSRKTLALLQERGVEPVIVEYLKSPPTKEEVKSFLALLGGDAHAIVRKKEPVYAESGLTAASTAEEVAAAIAQHPVLLERPLVIHGKKAALGRPPENVLNIL